MPNIIVVRISMSMMALLNSSLQNAKGCCKVSVRQLSPSCEQTVAVAKLTANHKAAIFCSCCFEVVHLLHFTSLNFICDISETAYQSLQKSTWRGAFVTNCGHADELFITTNQSCSGVTPQFKLCCLRLIFFVFQHAFDKSNAAFDSLSCGKALRSAC
ncbi:hypothetical protein MRB53_037694 [Persea americana]|nr:hypothetical protein MRB53_037694 [Persea americana]